MIDVNGTNVTNFWQTTLLAKHFGDNIALVVHEQAKTLTYNQLAQQVNSAKALIKTTDKQLIVIKSTITIETVVFYLAALELKHVVWFIDEILSSAELSTLCQYYQVNYLINNGNVEHLNKKTLTLADDLALLNTTSGSTGSNKLVKISFDNLQENCASICQCLPIQSSDVVITTLPLHYSFGLSVLNSHLSCGATIVLNKDALITREFWLQFSQYQITSFYGVPYLYELLLTLKLARLNLHSLRYFAVAGGKLLPAKVKQLANWCQQKNKTLYLMYGQTEATARISCLLPDKVLKKPNSIGQSIVKGHLWLEDQQNNIIEEPNKIGQLYYQGANVMMGLAQSVADLALKKQNDILPTGDLAYKDDDGDFYITGRLTRFIKIQGHRINLDEVETFLHNNNIEAYCLAEEECFHCFIMLKNKQEGSDTELKEKTSRIVSSFLKLHSRYFTYHLITNKPMLSSGKVDYQTLKKLISAKDGQR